ncbi:hypothetical protein [Paenibacillus sp. GCM10012306]|uniref:hypothetical protein n=1 Tax=Paenibacillus sp. GCM10012306 TaxID=3317342 RepID=UPI00360879D4
MTKIDGILKLVYDRVSIHTDMDWIVVGSVASKIQGCEDIQPNGLDILLKQSADVERIAQLFTDYLPETNPSPIFNKHWLSTTDAPTYSMNEGENKWSFLRLNIDGVIIEIANTASDEYLELSSKVWKMRRVEDYLGMSIPVAPLEVQLHSNYELAKPERIKVIREVIQLQNRDVSFMENYLSESAYQQLTQ